MNLHRDSWNKAEVHSLQTEVDELKRERQLRLDTCIQDEFRMSQRDTGGDGDGGRSLEETGKGTYTGESSRQQGDETKDVEMEQIEGNKERVDTMPLKVNIPADTVICDDFLKVINGLDSELEEGEIQEITREKIASYFKIRVEDEIMDFNDN